MLDENIVIGAVYVPPENSKFFNDDEFMTFENEISQICSDHKYVILAGDFNGRVGSMKDYITTDPHLNDIFDIDDDIQSQLDKYKTLEKLSVPLARTSQDHRTNAHGCTLMVDKYIT